MEYFNDKSSRQEPGYFFSNSFASLFIEPAEKLLDRFILGINIESVLSEFSRYTWDVRRLPCKDVPILTDELDERAFLFGIQIAADAELLRRVTWGKVNKLRLGGRFKLQRRVMLCSWFLEGVHIRRVNIVLIKFELLRGTGHLSVSRLPSSHSKATFRLPCMVMVPL